MTCISNPDTAEDGGNFGISVSEASVLVLECLAIWEANAEKKDFVLVL